MTDRPFHLERTSDTQFHNLLSIISSNWNLYEVDSKCDLLVVHSLKDPLLNRASAMLSLSWLGQLKTVLPIAVVADDQTSRLSFDSNQIRDRSWLQERTDPLPLTFTKFNGSLVISDFYGEWIDPLVAEDILGKFLFEEIQALSEKAFSKMISLVPELTMTQFNFGIGLDHSLKLIGCPGHLINSSYSRSFVLNFLDFWMSP